MKLTINRAAWQRGVGCGSFLSQQHGSRVQCVVGAYLTALGVADTYLYALPKGAVPAAAMWLFESVDVNINGELVHSWKSSALACEIFRTNDTPLAGALSAASREALIAVGSPVFASDRAREARLIELFAKVDIELEFENGAPVMAEQLRSPGLEFQILDEAMLESAAALVVPKVKAGKIAGLSLGPGALEVFAGPMPMDGFTVVKGNGGGYKIAWLEK